MARPTPFQIATNVKYFTELYHDAGVPNADILINKLAKIHFLLSFLENSRSRNLKELHRLHIALKTFDEMASLSISQNNRRLELLYRKKRLFRDLPSIEFDLAVEKKRRKMMNIINRLPDIDFDETKLKHQFKNKKKRFKTRSKKKWEKRIISSVKTNRI